jgi:apolipoprotein N-acyltransferase
MRRLSHEGLACLSGVLLTLSFPKFGHAAVAWVALSPLLVALAAKPGALRAVRLGAITGFVSSLGLVYWTALVVEQFGGASRPVSIGVMLLLCLALSLFTALFCWTVAGWLRAFGSHALLFAPLAWVATEVVRAYTLLRFSWCLLGYSQHNNLPFVQVARYTAVYGVSFLVAGVSAVLAYVALEKDGKRRKRVVLAAGAVVAGLWAHGVWLMGRPIPESGRVRVGLVQASILQDEKWDSTRAWHNVDRHLALTRQAVAQGARLLVWPESAVPFYFDRTPELAGELRALVRGTGIHLVFGNDDREDGSGRSYRVWVGVKMLDPQGELRLRYHKMRLVPFGEYLPLQSLLRAVGVEKLVEEVGEFTPGTTPELGLLDGHRLGTFICYEAIFPDLVREFTARGADLLVNVTNDGWYGRTSAPHQHLAMASFRAVENGRYLVRAANTGITAVVDPRGRILERTELFVPTVLVREVPFVSGSTFYARYGDVFAWACFFAALGLTLVALRSRR